MALFDAVLGNTSQIANSLLGKATTYVVQSAGTKVNEAANKLASTIGVNLPFDKLGASLPSVSQLAADAITSGAQNLSPFFQQQVDAIIDSNSNIVSAESINQAVGTSAEADDTHMVSLQHEAIRVTFPVMPQISEQRSVGYEEVQPSQSPAPFQKYKGTGATVWTVNAMLISRNVIEATDNLNRLMWLRGWTKPYFGEGTAQIFASELGAPPPVLTFNGFRGALLGPVPVVIQSLTWDWPRDVDYIATSHPGDKGHNFVPFPTVLNISISLHESYSPAEMNRFNLAAFRAGNLLGAFQSTDQRAFEQQANGLK